ncbi:snRNA-activating protein complex subunit 2-like, partial [Tupaia chinensis]|uniref:snRNA-activating protein complex subunit 2-like n=1 Tax=Tupaia chinensis TaxID=246437 RepID=UPI0003C8DB85
PTSETSGPAPETLSRSLAGSLAEGEFTVDFEKVYKYLSSSSCGSRCPELSAAEAAVVLDLITSLPEELPRLPCAALIKHMEETYRRLTAPQPCPTAGSPPPGAQDIGTGSKGPEGLGPTTPHAGENAGLSDLRPAWRAAGICPLNPFLVPLEL